MTTPKDDLPDAVVQSVWDLACIVKRIAGETASRQSTNA